MPTPILSRAGPGRCRAEQTDVEWSGLEPNESKLMSSRASPGRSRSEQAQVDVESYKPESMSSRMGPG